MSIEFNEIDLRRVDLNLLVVFGAIARTRSVREAAARLRVGPSAVSMALARLRDVFGDPLFVRGRRGMEPTARALLLFDRIAPALAEIRAAVVEGPAFDPATATSTVRFAASDELEIALLPRLFRAIRARAPSMTLVVRPSDLQTAAAILDERDADLALVAGRLPDERRLAREVLYAERFCAMFDPRALPVPGRLGERTYLATPHVIVSSFGRAHGLVDARLAELDKARRVVAAVARTSTLPTLLRGERLLAEVPAVAARHLARASRLAVRELPFASPHFDVALVWDARRDADPALAWLRTLVREIVAALRDEAARS